MLHFWIRIWTRTIPSQFSKKKVKTFRKHNNFTDPYKNWIWFILKSFWVRWTRILNLFDPISSGWRFFEVQNGFKQLIRTNYHEYMFLSSLDDLSLLGFLLSSVSKQRSRINLLCKRSTLLKDRQVFITKSATIHDSITMFMY